MSGPKHGHADLQAEQEAALRAQELAVRPAVPDGAFGQVVVDATLVLNGLALVANLIPVGRTDGALCLRWLVHHSRTESRLGPGEQQPLP